MQIILVKIMKIKELKIIINYIINNFDSTKIRVDKYIFNNAEKLIEELNLNYSTSKLLDELGDISNKEYNKFIERFDLILKKKGAKARVNISKDGIFPEIELSEFGKKINTGERKSIIKLLNKLDDLDDYKKGIKYEEFCSLFLRDIGFETKLTPQSNDEGIDILGKFNVFNDNNLFQNYFYTQGYLLVQAKYYSKKVDIPIIRNLIGNSLLIKFENNEVNISHSPTILLCISHSGFTKRAYKFSKANNISLITSNDIADLICTIENSKRLKCLNYIK